MISQILEGPFSAVSKPIQPIGCFGLFQIASQSRSAREGEGRVAGSLKERHPFPLDSESPHRNSTQALEAMSRAPTSEPVQRFGCGALSALGTLGFKRTDGAGTEQVPAASVRGSE